MHTLSRLYLVLAIAAAAGGAYQWYRWNQEGVSGIVVLVNLLPAAALLMAWVGTRNAITWWAHVLALAAVITVVGVWFAVRLPVEWFLSATRTVTDAGQYESVLRDYWKNGELVSHFPRPVPNDATNVRFSFAPRFMQGGSHIQLRMTLPRERVAEHYSAFARRKTASYLGGDMGVHMNLADGMPTTSFYTGGAGVHAFPGDYEVMIFDPLMKKEDSPGGYWNHGRSHGVAISLMRNEIVYWAEEW